MENSETARIIVCLTLLGVSIPLVFHCYDNKRNMDVEKIGMTNILEAISYGKKVDPVVAYKGDTMRRLNNKGTWLSEKDVKNVIDQQLLDYMKFLPDDRKNWTIEQRQVFDYAMSTIKEFEKNPDKTAFRERITQDLLDAGLPQKIQSGSPDFKKTYSKVNEKINER